MLPYALVASILSLVFCQDKATLVFAGDAMMHESQLRAAKQPDGFYSFWECFERVAPFVESADYAVVNLETPLGGKPYSGYPCFCAPDSYAEALDSAGFDLFLSANNHILDRHDRGLKRTIDVIQEYGWDHAGIYRNKQERESACPLIKNINGIKIAFLNYTYGTNGIEVQGDVVVDYIDKDKIVRDVKTARDRGAELVCAAVHWGEEYKLLPNKSQRALGHFLLEQDVDMVIGGHPHVIQPMEIVEDSIGRKRLLIYSLGNFISGMRTRDTRGGAMAKVWISRPYNGKAQIDSAAYKLVFTVPGAPGQGNFRLVDADSCDSKQWVDACEVFKKSAMGVFDLHNVNVPRIK